MDVHFFSSKRLDVDVNGKQLCFIVLVRFDGYIKVLTLKEGSAFTIMFVGFCTKDTLLG